MLDLANIWVLSYIFIGYATGIFTLLCGDQTFFSRSIAITLLTHTITWSAYIHHELCHNSVFESTLWNTRFGYILSWINGSSYWTFHELKKQHINHHIYKVDYDIATLFLKWIEENKFVKGLLCVCEYVYFPLNAYIIHWRSILSPWWKVERTNMRWRTTLVIVLRVFYFWLLFYYGGLSAILCYLTAYSISIQITRFTDAFSHDYEVVPVGSKTKVLSKQYDMLHTYSVVWEPNDKASKFLHYLATVIHIVLFLNFNFHNQHHYATQKKWFQLGISFQSEKQTIVEKKLDSDDNSDEFIMNHQPEGDETKATSLHEDSLCGVPKKHFTIPLVSALWAFHIHRVTRLFSQPGKPIIDPTTGELSLGTCYGVADAPLLALEV